MEEINNFCIAPGYSTSDVTDIICSFTISTENIPKIVTKSTYDKCLAKDASFKGNIELVARL